MKKYTNEELNIISGGFETDFYNIKLPSSFRPCKGSYQKLECVKKLMKENKKEMKYVEKEIKRIKEKERDDLGVEIALRFGTIAIASGMIGFLLSEDFENCLPPFFSEEFDQLI